MHSWSVLSAQRAHKMKPDKVWQFMKLDHPHSVNFHSIFVPAALRSQKDIAQGKTLFSALSSKHMGERKE